ncbi:MAG: V-type ATPase subunit subunit G family protein [Methanoregulaceae archaeon]
MEEERTLLQQIRDKERELGNEMDRLRKESEAGIAAARAEADHVLKQAEEEGRRIADSHIRKARESTDAEIKALAFQESALMETLRAQGERNIPAAAERIAKFVTSRDR